jgi:hypothetical protein
MKPEHNRWDIRSLLAGSAAGAGTILLANSILNRDPDKRPEQLLVNRALDKRLRACQTSGPIPLTREGRFVIFSDHHKGARTLADPFPQCEATYLNALDYYLENGFTLIILGDAEELLEESIPHVIDAYPNVLNSETRFHPERLIRIYGNHDIYWQVEEIVQKYLHPFFPGIHFRQDLIFRFTDQGEHLGEIFLIHGHQGNFWADALSFLAERALPYYRDLQILTGFGTLTSPSKDDCLRSQQDNRMYRWVSRKSKLILVAAHTHRPVWSSKTLFDKLANQLHNLLQLEIEEQSANHEEQILALMEEIERRQELQPTCDDILKTRPCYFNTGCCMYADGDITGVEVEGGYLRLIKWGPRDGQSQRTILEQNPLKEIFFYL